MNIIVQTETIYNVVEYRAASNEHIAIIAAVPRGINILKIKYLLALKVCWEAATTAICHHVSGKWWTEQPKRTECQCEQSF
jgi:hypothetical protein